MAYGQRKIYAREYYVWVKGKRISTEQKIGADDKPSAIWKFALRHNIKTIDCDAMWIRVTRTTL